MHCFNINFRGPSLLTYLDEMPPISRALDAPVRLPIVDRYRVSLNHSKRILAAYYLEIQHLVSHRVHIKCFDLVLYFFLYVHTTILKFIALF